MPQLTLTLEKNTLDALNQYAKAANKTAEAIAENILDIAMVHFLIGVRSGIDQSLDILRAKPKTPATATPPPITSEPHTLESEASKISDVYKF